MSAQNRGRPSTEKSRTALQVRDIAINVIYLAIRKLLVSEQAGLVEALHRNAAHQGRRHDETRERLHAVDCICEIKFVEDYNVVD